MDFQDRVSWCFIKDRLPEDCLRKNNNLHWQIPYGETSFYFRCQIVERGITISDRRTCFDHQRPMFTRVFLFRKGGAELICRGERHILTENRIYILPADMSFQVRYFPRELIYYHLCLNDSNGLSIFEREEPFWELQVPDVHTQFLHAQERENEMHHQAALLSLFAEFLPPRLDQLHKRQKQQQEFFALFDFFDTHPPAQITISDLADLYGVDCSTLSKRFHRKMGFSLKHYIQERQLRQACELLLYSSKKIAEIARILGHREVSYFYRFFKKQTGKTPQEFRTNEATEI